MPEHTKALVVALRVRPMNKQEGNVGAKHIAHTVDQNLVVLLDPNEDSEDTGTSRSNRSREKQYKYDFAFDRTHTSADVYEHTMNGVIKKITSGFNVTVFAYGATGAGKTHTMLGTDSEPGIMVLTLDNLFRTIQATEEDSIYRVKLGYLEIYNETIRDLLSSSGDFLELREDSSGDMVVAGLEEVDVTNTARVLRLLQKGNQRRTSEPTAINKTSSRSHALLKVTVEQRSRVMDVSQTVMTGVLYMVDLAGSERASITQNRGKRMIEGAHINRSLLALANCINALGSGHKPHYVNYRDSKLTRLLKDSLGGNCRTVMIAHISPSSTCFEESRNTLKYAARARCIRTKVVQNAVEVTYHVTQYHTIIAELRSTIYRLEKEKAAMMTAGAASFSSEHDSVCEVEELVQQSQMLLQEEKEIRQELLALEYHLVQNSFDTQRHLAGIQQWEGNRSSLTVSQTAAAGHMTELPRSHVSHVTEQHPAFVNDAVVEEPHDKDVTDDVSHMTEQAVSRDTHTQPPNTLPPTSLERQGLSPDSGAESSGGPSLEPFDVSSAREEVATLVGDKQRMEAQHKRLQRRLREIRVTEMELQQRLSALTELPSLQRQLVALLHHCRELERKSLEQGRAATLAGAHLARREATVEQLVRQNSDLMELLLQHRSLMEEHPMAVPVDLTTQYQGLLAQQKTLGAQVAAEKHLPPCLGQGLQLPSIARLSAKLYSTTTASKSNLLLEGGVLGEEVGVAGAEKGEGDELEGRTATSRGYSPFSPIDLGDVHLPSITVSSHTSIPLPSQFSAFSLPPLPPHNTPLVSARPDGRRQPVAELPAALTAAIFRERAFDLPTTRIRPTLTSPKRLLSKVSSLTTPRISVSRCSSQKYVVPAPAVSVRRRGVLSDFTMGGQRTDKGQPIRRRDRVGLPALPKAQKFRSQPQLSAGFTAREGAVRRKKHNRGNSETLPGKSVLSETAKRKLEQYRAAMTIEEVETVSSATLPGQQSSDNETAASSEGRGERKLTEITPASKIAPARSITSKSPATVATSTAVVMKKRGRRKVEDTAMASHTKTAGSVPARRKPPIPHVARRKPPTRKELSLAKVNAGSQLSNFVSPYLISLRRPRKEGPLREGR